MKSIIPVVLIALLSLVSTPPVSMAIDIRTKDGREFKNAEIFRREPDRITITYSTTHSKGIATIYLHELTDDLQKHFQYDPKKAQHYRKEKRVKQEIETTGVTLTWRVSQMISKEVVLGYTYLNGILSQICVVGPFAQYVVDDRVYRDKLYTAGRYTFTTVAGAQRTVLMYALTPELAYALVSGRRDPIPNRIQEAASSGTGWITQNGLIVTCWHVVKDKKNIFILSNTLEKHEVAVLAKDPKNDIVVLTPKRGLDLPNGIPVAIKQPVLGQAVFTIGYPFLDILGKKPKVSDGVVSALSGLQDDARFLQVTVPVQPGNSGGPLLTRQGKVVGIITSKLSALAMLMWSGDIPENVNFAIKSKHLRDLLRPAKREPPSRGGFVRERKLSEVVKSTQESIVIILAE